MQISCCSHINLVMNILWMSQETHHVQVNFSRQILSLDWVIFVSDFVMSTVTLWVAGLLTTRKYEVPLGLKFYGYYFYIISKTWIMFLQTKEIITQQEYTPSVSGGDVKERRFYM